MEHFEVVFKRAHPGRHFFFFRAGQEADVFADADCCARHDDFGEAPLIDRLRERCGERHERFARACLAENRHEVDFRIHEQVERHVLLAVAGVNAPNLEAALGAVVLE